jgi:hypothetical protein
MVTLLSSRSGDMRILGAEVQNHVALRGADAPEQPVL